MSNTTEKDKEILNELKKLGFAMKPTYVNIQNWLRENHNLFFTFKHEPFYIHIKITQYDETWENVTGTYEGGNMFHKDDDFKTYEEYIDSIMSSSIYYGMELFIETTKFYKKWQRELQKL